VTRILPSKITPNNALLNSRESVFIGAFNVRTLCQIGQQASLAETLLSLKIDVCCVSETRIQDPTSVIHLKPLRANPAISQFTLRVSGDPAATARGLYGVGVALSPRAERALLDWIPVNSRLCAVRLAGSIKVNANRHGKRCLFVVSAYAPTDGSSEQEKDDFYRELSRLIRLAKRSDIIILAGDMNAQIGQLHSSETHLGGHFSVDAQRTDNGDRLLQLCNDHQLFLASTNFQHKRSHRVTWKPPCTSQSWTQLDHIAISFRWRASIQDCRSFWCTPLDSDHAILRAHLSVRFHSGHRKRTSGNPTLHVNTTAAQQYRQELDAKLFEFNEYHTHRSTLEEDWDHLKTAMISAAETVHPRSPIRQSKHWISARSAALIESRKTIPATHDFDRDRRALKRRILTSLRRDREQWWKAKAQAMEKAFASGNNRTLFHLVRSIGPRKQNVSETITEKNGSMIYSLERRLERWAEHFEEQFNQPAANAPILGIPEAEWSVNTQEPTYEEIQREVNLLKRDKAPGLDGLHPSLFKEGGRSLIISLTNILQTVWNEERLPKEWTTSTVIPVFKKGARSLCENHRGISLVNVASKVLSGLILHRLTDHREKQIRENQAGFRPGRGCIDHIFALRQILELRHSFQQPTLIVFLDLKSAFDSVDRQALWQCLSIKGVPSKFLSILKALYANPRGRVRVYGQLSPEFSISSGVRQGCPLSPFLFNFVIDLILQSSLPVSASCGVELLPGGCLTDMEYADDIALLGSDPSQIQIILNNLTNAAARFGMHFAPAKCKVLLQDWSGSSPNLVLAGEPIEVVDKFIYLGSCISAGGLAGNEISLRIGKARAAFLQLRHLWHRRDVSLSVKGRVYSAAVRPILLYGSETWPLRADDVRKLSAFDHRCLRSIARVWWERRISNAEVRRMVFGQQKAHAIDKLISLHRLRWLGHVLRMSPDRLPRRALFAQPCAGWKRLRGGQQMTWQRSMKALTSSLSRVGNCRLPGWGPRDPPTKWLETLTDMAQSRHQWRTCIHAIAFNA